MAELSLSSSQALLAIGAQDSAVTTSGAGGRVVRIALGYAGVPVTLFGGDIPTPLELENAIAAVEDEVMPAVRQLAGVESLLTVDPELHVLAAEASAEPSGALPLEGIGLD